MIIGNPIIRHFAKLLALKKIGDYFNRLFVITNTEKFYMIASILFMN